MSSALGQPQLPLSQADEPAKASPEVKRLLKSITIRGTRFQGIGPFVDLLNRVFSRAKAANPDLITATGSAGILVVRYQRGSTSAISNHSWGTAIDFEFADSNGVLRLNNQGSGQVQLGASLMYEFFRQEGDASGEYVYWGAGFRGRSGSMSREDAMHFEASAELLKAWKAAGKI